MTTPVTPQELNDFCSTLDRVAADNFDRMGFKHTVPTHSAMKGRKFSRIVRNDGVQQCVVVFVELSTGNIYKPASWKGPARNFPRGNIRNDLDWITPVGTCSNAR